MQRLVFIVPLALGALLASGTRGGCEGDSRFPSYILNVPHQSPSSKTCSYALSDGAPPVWIKRIFSSLRKKPWRARPISPAIAFPVYTGSSKIASVRASIWTASTIIGFGREYWGCQYPPIATTASRGIDVFSPNNSATATASRCTKGSCSAGSRLTPIPTIGMGMLLPIKPASSPPWVPELPDATTT